MPASLQVPEKVFEELITFLPRLFILIFKTDETLAHLLQAVDVQSSSLPRLYVVIW